MTGPMLHQLLFKRVILVLLVMLEVVLVLVIPTYNPQKDSFYRDRKYWRFKTSQNEHKTSSMGSLISRYYPVGASDGSSFGDGDGSGDGKGGVGPRTNHLTSQIVDCQIDGGNVVISRNWNYSSMSNQYNYRSYASSNFRWEVYYGTDGDGVGGVGTRTTYLSPSKDMFGRDRHNSEFKTSHHEHTVSHITSSFIIYYS